MPESHSAGIVTRSSAYSSVPTAGTVAWTPPSVVDTEPVSGPCAHTRTLSPAEIVSPEGTGRLTVQVTFCDGTSQPSVTNFQYSSPTSS